MAELGTVQVVVRGTGQFVVSISDGRHGWIANEPASVGGDDLGPGPYELLLAALGACAVMTLRMVARQKDWPLERAAVTLAHARVHAEVVNALRCRFGAPGKPGPGPWSNPAFSACCFAVILRQRSDAPRRRAKVPVYAMEGVQCPSER